MTNRVLLATILVAEGIVCSGWGTPGTVRGQDQPPLQHQEPAPRQGTEFGFAVFQQHCMTCHGNPGAAQRAPEPNTLRQLSPEAIYDALATGSMKTQGESLTDEEKRLVAEGLSGKRLGSLRLGDAKGMPNQCGSNPRLGDPAGVPGWNGWAWMRPTRAFSRERVPGWGLLRCRN